MLFADYVLSPPSTIVAVIALSVVVLGGSQFLLLGATLISKVLVGRRKTQFQFAVSIAVPVVIALLLAARTDTIPLETLELMLTPWLLVPLGIIALICWYAGDHVNREHPFRGFVVTAAVIGVLCWFWSAGMTAESSYTGEASSMFLDPEKAKRAKETGEYVWRFGLYVTTAYLVLFLKLTGWPRQPREREAYRTLNDAQAVQDVIPRMMATIDQQATEINTFTNRLDAAYEELQSTNARLKETSFKDEVTGLYNRRFFALRLEEEISRYHRQDHPVSVVLLDLDGFEAIKNEYGRAVSEDTLREMAQILMAHSRGINVVSRHDADLFAVLLVETSNEGAQLYANRIREAVTGHRFSHHEVTTSFGIASLPHTDATTAGDLFHAADDALFRAKRGKKTAAEGGDSI